MRRRYLSREERRRHLENYRDDIAAELAEVEKRIEELKSEAAAE